jgi:hypothetical protein
MSILSRAESLYGRVVGPREAGRVFDRLGYRISDWKYGKPAVIPHEASQYLQPENPRLQELEERYSGVKGLEHSAWNWHRARLNKFRGEGDYLNQATADPLASYIASFGYAMALDKEGLFDGLTEDHLFGCHAFPALGRLVSRDLVDSMLEIQFLNEMMGLGKTQEQTVLDIGAGYGRLAHRLVTVFPHLRVMCTDGIPVSTFLAEFYLRFRQAKNASVLPLYEVPNFSGPVELATNIHSWSECTLQSIRWWLDRLDAIRPKFLFVVPHTEEVLAREPDDTKPSFLPEIINRGWKLAVKRHKYHLSPLLIERGAYPAWYFLFER